MCSLAGTVVASAEAGPGVAEALLAGPEGSGVRSYKARTGTEGVACSIKAGTGVSVFLFQTERTGTRVWWLGMQEAGTGIEEGEGSPLSRVVEPPYFRLTAYPGGSSRLQGEPKYSGVEPLGCGHGLEKGAGSSVSSMGEPPYFRLTAHPGGSS